MNRQRRQEPSPMRARLLGSNPQRSPNLEDRRKGQPVGELVRTMAGNVVDQITEPWVADPALGRRKYRNEGILADHPIARAQAESIRKYGERRPKQPRGG